MRGNRSFAKTVSGQTQEELRKIGVVTHTQGHDELPVVTGYGRGDTLAFTGDRHFHGTLPTTAGERVVLTFFFEILPAEVRKRTF
jgi:hypothetical protein